MAKVIGYVRVSTDQQVEDGASLDAQRAQIAAYCQTYQLELVEVIEDAGLSASTLLRPGLQRALGLVGGASAATKSPSRKSKQRPADTSLGLVVTKLDRLTRSVRDLSALIDSGAGTAWTLHSVSERLDTSTATGELMLHLLISVAQWERKIIGERTSATLKHIQSQGQYLGRVPYGYRLDKDAGRLVEVPDEQAVLARVRGRRAAGATLEAIATELDADGIKGTRGGRWTPMSVKRALARS